MMGTREKMRSGDEYDALTRRGRRALKLFWKPGIAAKTKRRFWKRIRKSGRLNASSEATDER